MSQEDLRLKVFKCKIKKFKDKIRNNSTKKFFFSCLLSKFKNNMNAQLRNTCIDLNYLLETRGGTMKALRVEGTGSNIIHTIK